MSPSSQAGSLLAAITGRDIAVIACAAAGGAVCVGIILGAIIYARRNAMLKPMPDDGNKKFHVPRIWRDPRPSAAGKTSVAKVIRNCIDNTSGRY